MLSWWRAYSDVHKLQCGASADMNGINNVVHVQHYHCLVICSQSNYKI